MPMETKSRTEHPDKPDNKIGGAPPWSEAVFRELADNINDGVYCINADGYFTFVNRAIIERSGMSPDKFYASHFLDIVHFAYHDLAAQNFQKVMIGENGMPYELRYEGADGQERIVEVNSKPIRSDGKIVGLLGISRNITERKQAEEALKASEQKYRILMENASDAILLADTQGNIVEANRKAEELWGYTKEDLLQMHYTQLHPMPEMERTIAAFKEIIEKNTGHLSNAFIQRNDGDIVPVDIACNVIEYAGKKVIQGSFRDISEHKHERDELEKLVNERTAELFRNNEQLKLEIKERKRAQGVMKKKSRELKHHADKLTEMNAALKVLLKQREDDKNDLEDKVTSNVKELLLPYIEEMKNRKIYPRGRVFLSILETNLQNIISPFTQKLSSKYVGLTPREVQVADLIRQGKSTKEIARFMGISTSAISLHRYHIREKLGLIEQKINLRTHLQSLS
jgi:PAS domain S-box-containing protein